ncbi:hypothetical protein J7M00_04215, partial [bacterium]|nr:hypothetical protein [bacterium]
MSFNKNLFVFILIFSLVFSAPSERIPHERSEAPPMPIYTAPMVSIPYFNDFESDITGWGTWARHDPMCIE